MLYLQTLKGVRKERAPVFPRQIAAHIIRSRFRNTDPGDPHRQRRFAFQESRRKRVFFIASEVLDILHPKT
jgi:hypothetical protein